MNYKNYRLLGKTGLMVSRIGLASGYGVQANAVEKAFYEYGINFHFLSSPRKKGRSFSQGIFLKLLRSIEAGLSG